MDKMHWSKATWSKRRKNRLDGQILMGLAADSRPDVPTAYGMTRVDFRLRIDGLAAAHFSPGEKNL